MRAVCATGYGIATQSWARVSDPHRTMAIDEAKA